MQPYKNLHFTAKLQLQGKQTHTTLYPLKTTKSNKKIDHY